MKHGFLIAAVVLIVVGLALFAGAWAASGFDLTTLGPKLEENTYTVDEAFQKIEISETSADLRFLPSEDGSFRAVCTEREKVRHLVRVENGTLKIDVEDSRAWYEHSDLFQKASSVTVYLPAEAYASLTVESHTGDVSVPAPFRFGSVSVRVSTGDIDFGASAEGSLELKASTGSIRLEGVSAASVSLSDSTGGIDAGSVVCAGDCAVKTGTGSVRLTDLRCESLAAEGGTGSIELNNVLASGSFRLETRTGDVRLERCDAGEITIRTSTGDVTGSLLSEKVFLAKSSTGSIRVPDTITGGRCEITTSTGSIRITLAD